MNKILEEITAVNPDNPLEYCRKIIAPFAIDKLNSIIDTCTHCKTASYCHKLGSGNPDANILIITDNATNNDDVYDYLNSLLEQAEIDINDVYTMNAVSCINTRGHGDNTIVRAPSYEELNNCKLYVDHAIDVIRPRVIILMGASSLNMFTKAIFNNEISNWIKVKDIPAMVTYSPQDIYSFMEYMTDEELNDKATVLLKDLITVNKYIQDNK